MVWKFRQLEKSGVKLQCSNEGRETTFGPLSFSPRNYQKIRKIEDSRPTLLTIDVDSFSLASSVIAATLFFISRRKTFFASWIAILAIVYNVRFYQAFHARVGVLSFPISQHREEDMALWWKDRKRLFRTENVVSMDQIITENWFPWILNILYHGVQHCLNLAFFRLECK